MIIAASIQNNDQYKEYASGSLCPYCLIVKCKIIAARKRHKPCTRSPLISAVVKVLYYFIKKLFVKILKTLGSSDGHVAHEVFLWPDKSQDTQYKWLHTCWRMRSTR